MMRHYTLCGALLLLAISPVFAQSGRNQRCTIEEIQRTRSALQINESAEIRASACALWGKRILVAIALESPRSTQQNPLDLPLHLAVFNAENFDLVASYLGALPDGGGEEVREGSLWFDVGRFNLARNISAFGMKVTQTSTARCGEGGSDGQLSLFYVQGRQLVPVFSEPLTTHYYQFVGGLPCATDSYKTEEIKLSISMAKPKLNEFADLLVTRTKTGSKAKVFRVRHDGKSYPVHEIMGKLGRY